MTLDPRVFKNLDWWQWAIVAVLLVAHFLGAIWAVPSALALCAVMAVGLWGILGSLRPLAVQLRFASVLVLSTGLWPETSWLLVVPLLGTATNTLMGYCPMRRMLGLAPWNRTLRITLPEAQRILFSLPERGGILRVERPASPSTPLRRSARAAA